MPTSGDVKIRTLFDAEAIAARNEALAQEIKAAALDRMLVVAVLKGSFIFAADLIRALHAAGLAPEVEFVSLSSYREGTVSSGTVTILHDVESDVRGRDVLLVDDILESGRTLAYAKDLFAARGARARAHLRAAGEAGQARGVARRRLRRLRLPRSVRRRLRHGRRARVPAIAVRRRGREITRPMARILIAEDEEALRALTARALTNSGHEVVTAVDGADALEFSRARAGVSSCC